MNQHRAEGKEHFLNQILRNMEVPCSDLDFSKTISDLDFGAPTWAYLSRNGNGSDPDLFAHGSLMI